MASLSPQARAWRWRIFAATWLSYAGFYFCRKPFFIVKAALSEELSWDPSMLGLIGTAYLVAYALGQFAAGALGTRFGSRLLLLGGMAVTLVANLAFGFTNSAATFAALMVVNGLAQATGWSGNVAALGPWYARKERGTIMGIWGTNYQLGGVLANTMAAWILGQWGYQWSFFAGSAVMLFVWTFFLFNQRNHPEDVGLDPIADDEAPTGADGAPTQGLGWTRDVVINVLLVGLFYFFVKFIRYALWSWTPFLLRRDYGMDLDDAGFLSTLFDVGGIAGVIAAGWLSDKLFNGRRAKVSFFLILAMAASTLLLYLLGPASLVFFGISVTLVGFSLYGPDSLMSGAGAIDVGSLRGAALAAGIINGMGSIGAVVQELLLGRMLDTAGAGPVFATLVASSLLAATALSAVLVRNRMGKADL